MKQKIPFAAGLCLLTLVCLAACGEDPVEPPSPQASASTPASSGNPSASPKPGASGTPKPTPTPLPPLAAGLIDVSGCWQAVGTDGFANGNPIELVRTDADAFVFGGAPQRTKLVFRPDRGFSETNFDEVHPFFPKGYVHSNGVVSEDGNSIERTVVGEESHPQSLKRCGTIPDRPYVPIGSATPGPSPTAPAVGLSASASPTTQPSESPKPVASTSPSPKATPTPTPSPKITPTPTPKATPTPTPTPGA